MLQLCIRCFKVLLKSFILYQVCLLLYLINDGLFSLFHQLISIKLNFLSLSPLEVLEELIEIVLDPLTDLTHGCKCLSPILEMVKLHEEKHLELETLAPPLLHLVFVLVLDVHFVCDVSYFIEFGNAVEIFKVLIV